MGLNFYVNENVLIPQPDTEILVEEVLQLLKQNVSKKILDICTGSGAIAISIAKMQENSTVTASDISEEAINIAGYNKVEPTTKTITIGTEENIINFYYTKRTDLSYIVNFYEVGTKDKIAESETIENVVFETVVDSKKHAKAIDGYNFGHCDPATLTVGVNVEENVIDIYYSRANGLTYTVNYVEKDNEEIYFIFNRASVPRICL